MQFAFLGRFFNLLKVITQSLIKFILEGSSELKYVSINALKTISQRCKTKFITIQECETKTLLDTILEAFPAFLNNLIGDEFVEVLKCIVLLIRTFPDEVSRIDYLNQIFAIFQPIYQSFINESFTLSSESSSTLIFLMKCYSTIFENSFIMLFTIFQRNISRPY